MSYTVLRGRCFNIIVLNVHELYHMRRKVIVRKTVLMRDYSRFSIIFLLRDFNENWGKRGYYQTENWERESTSG